MRYKILSLINLLNQKNRLKKKLFGSKMRFANKKKSFRKKSPRLKFL